MSNPQDFFTGLKESQEGPFGIANQYIGDIEKRKAYKLELAMKSSIIEQELAARMQAERVQQEQANLIKQEQYNIEQHIDPEFAKSLVSPGEAVPTTMREAAYATKLRQTGIMAGSKTSRPQIRSINGQVTVITPDGKGGFGQTPLGLDSGLHKEAAKTVAAMEGPSLLLDQMRDMGNQVFTAKNWNGIITQYPNLKLNELSKVDPNASEYFDYVKAHAPMFAVALRGTSRVTETEIKNLLSALPNEMDTVSSFKQKMDNFDNLFNQMKIAKLDAFLNIGNANQIRQETKNKLSESLKAKEEGTKQPSAKAKEIADKIRAMKK